MDLPDVATSDAIKALAGAATAVLGVVGWLLGWFGKAWRAIVAFFRRETPSKGMLLFFVDQVRGAFWAAASSNGRPQLQVVIYLEASNTTDYPFRIMAATMHGRKAYIVNVGVEDLATGMYGHNHPIPAHQIVKMSVQFIIDTPPPADQARGIHGRLDLVDHNARKHCIRFVARGPKRK